METWQRVETGVCRAVTGRFHVRCGMLSQASLSGAQRQSLNDISVFPGIALLFDCYILKQGGEEHAYSIQKNFSESPYS